MYAHQVISDLEYTLKTRQLPDFRYRESIKLFIKFIKEAQHFFLGDFQEFRKPLATTLTEDTLVFLNESSRFARLPYNKCWFEFDNKFDDVPIEEDVPKRGMLVFEMASDLIWVWIANYTKAMNMWVLSPQQYYITIGKPLAEHKIFLDMLSTFGINYTRNEMARSNMTKSNVFPIPLSDAVDTITSQRLAVDDTRDLYVLNSALLLLNCKNIETEENNQPSKLNQKRRKKGKQELFSYKTLKLVLPASKKSEEKYVAIYSEEAKRIHLCRGHFKIYTESNPLFGKFIGVYWWQPHLRGDKKKGIVNKDYSVKTKSEN